MSAPKGVVTHFQGDRHSDLPAFCGVNVSRPDRKTRVAKAVTCVPCAAKMVGGGTPTPVPDHLLVHFAPPVESASEAAPCGTVLTARVQRTRGWDEVTCPACRTSIPAPQDLPPVASKSRLKREAIQRGGRPDASTGVAVRVPAPDMGAWESRDPSCCGRGDQETEVAVVLEVGTHTRQLSRLCRRHAFALAVALMTVLSKEGS